MAHIDRSNRDATPPGDDDVRINWEAVMKLGVPAVLCMYLVYRLANGIDSMGDQFSVRAQEHATMMNGITDIKQSAAQSEYSQRQVLYVLQAICVNQARTDAQRDECVRRIDGRR